MITKVDILAIGAHPDDVELSASGTLLKEIQAGKTVGLVDLTQGELGTRGSAELRKEEATKAAEIIGATFRVNLEMPDGFFTNTPEHQLKLIEVIRAAQPEIIVSNAPRDRHPDHAKGQQVVSNAAFYAGLRKIETHYNGELQAPWRPKAIYNYIQDRFIEPDIVVDVTAFWDKKVESILAYSSQFYNPNSTEPESPISSKSFLESIKGKAYLYGRYIGAELGEGFVVERPMGTNLLTDLL